MRFNSTQKTKRGFTLIELLVVIAVIGLLASIVLVATNDARLKGRIAKRAGDLKEIQTAMELYFNTNNSYPTTGGAYRSECATWGSYAANNVIPGLVPTYLASMPSDPAMKTATSEGCYLYISTGADYKLMDYNLTDMAPSDVGKVPPLIDPRRNILYINICGQNTATIAFAIYSLGARCW